MEAHSSEARSLRPRRKPLGDLTNAFSLRFSTAAESVKPRPKPKASPECSGTKSSVSSAGSSDPKNAGDLESPKSTFVAKGASSISVSGVSSSIKFGFSGGKSGLSSVKLQYGKEKRKEQMDVLFSAASSCPPLGRTRRLRKNSLMVKHGMNQNEACSEPAQKKKKRQRSLGSADADIPLQDFIQKQRAYFAEVDSFELPEEVVSESELE